MDQASGLECSSVNEVVMKEANKLGKESTINRKTWKRLKMGESGHGTGLEEQVLVPDKDRKGRKRRSEEALPVAELAEAVKQPRNIP